MPRQESGAASQAALTHFDRAGRARMVDVGEKPETERVAVASGRVRMARETVELIRAGRAAKGDVLAVAQVAAVMGAKKTADLIPMCHPLMLTRIDVAFDLGDGACRDRGNGRYARPHRRRNGGADRRGNGRADHLRHAEGG